jgi:EmrB/QacA subfamily drug resistance transporter
VSPAPPHVDPNRTLVALVTGATAFALAQTMVIPAIPAVMQQYGASPENATWLLTAFLLFAAVATPLAGRLGDMYGRDRLLLACLTIFGIGSLVAATAGSLEQLVAGRAIQGIGGGVIPLSMALVREHLPADRVGAGIGFIGATFGIGGGFGLVIAGVIVDNASVTWIFWLGAITTALAIVFVNRFVPRSTERFPAKLDWAGAGLLSVALASVLLAVSQGNAWGWGSARVLGLLALGLAVGVAWLAFERRQDEPLVDLSLMAERPIWTTNLTAFTLGFAMFGGFVLVPQLVETPSEVAGYGLGASATVAGLLLLPSSIVMLFAGPIGGRMGGRKPLLLGCVAAALGYTWMAFLHDTGFEIAAANALLGLGIGMSFAATANLIVTAAPAAKTGQAVAMNTIIRMVGGAVGAQVVAAIVAAERLPGSGLPVESGYTVAFSLAALGALVALAVGFLIPGPPRRRGALVPRPVAAES